MRIKGWMLVALMVPLTAGCWNGENVNVRLGDVSLGQQLIDLKRALDEGAISEQEYADTRQTLLLLNNLCENTESEAE